MKVNRTTISLELARRTARGESDREIARALGLGVSTVNHWRRRCGLSRADKFPARFEAKYGRGSLPRFVRLRQAGWTYRQLAAAFGFSRQYAQQVWAYVQERRQHAGIRD